MFERKLIKYYSTIWRVDINRVANLYQVEIGLEQEQYVRLHFKNFIKIAKRKRTKKHENNR